MREHPAPLPHPDAGTEGTVRLEILRNQGRHGGAVARVCGDALVSQGIRDGDVVVLDRRDGIEHGDLVAFRLGAAQGGLTLWRGLASEDGLRLVTDGASRVVAGPHGSDTTMPDMRSEGVVLAVLRRFADDAPDLAT